jgi:ribosome recycling factor
MWYFGKKYHRIAQEERIIMADVSTIKKDAEVKIHKAHEAFERACGALRTGRAHPALVENIMVEIYGVKQPLKQAAKINIMEARTLKIVPFDRSQVQAVEKAIRDSDLGINPTVTGTDILLSLPALTEERRKDLVKVLKDDTEKARVEIRNIRREANDGFKKLLKDKVISEDDEKRLIAEMQKMVDNAIKIVESVASKKEEELMKV